MSRHLPAISIALLAMALSGTGCEEIEATPEDLAATPEPAATTAPAEAPSSTRVSEGQSAYGKAYKRAERLEQQVNDYQDEVIKTADGVFDDSASRGRDD